MWIFRLPGQMNAFQFNLKTICKKLDWLNSVHYVVAQNNIFLMEWQYFYYYFLILCIHDYLGNFLLIIIDLISQEIAYFFYFKRLSSWFMFKVTGLLLCFLQTYIGKISDPNQCIQKTNLYSRLYYSKFKLLGDPKPDGFLLAL